MYYKQILYLKKKISYTKYIPDRGGLFECTELGTLAINLFSSGFFNMVSQLIFLPNINRS